MSSLFPKQITGIPDLMDTNPDQADTLSRISQVASPASIASSTEGAVHSDRVLKRVGSPYPTGKGPGSRAYNLGSTRRQGSPRPRDDHTTFLLALATSAKISVCVWYAWCVGRLGRPGRKSQFWMEVRAPISSGS